MISPEWETGYATGKHGVAVDRIIYWMLDNFCVGDQARVLELGCGMGGSITYWLNRSSDYYGIDGSETAINDVHQKWPCLRERVVCCDFTKDIPFGNFDVIFERASMSHNNGAAIRAATGRIFDALKPRGLFISADWFSTNHSEFRSGIPVDDANTKTGYTDGQFVGTGKVHFSDLAELGSLFAAFTGVFVQERVTRRPKVNDLVKEDYRFRWQSAAFDRDEYVSAVWDFVCRRER